MNFASGQHSAIRSAMKTSFGVLLTSSDLPRGGELALQQPVPQQEPHLAVVEPDLAERLRRVVASAP